MILIEKEFLKPTKKSRTLAILENLSLDSDVSQNDLSQDILLSSAMVNKYIKELREDGLIEFQPLDGKSIRYELTAAGQERRHHLLGQYCAEIVQIYTALKHMIATRLAPLQASRASNLVLFGASETCEVTISALKNLELRILAIVDNDREKQGRLFHGHVVYPPQVMENIPFDAVVITSFGRQDEIYRQLLEFAQFRSTPLQIIRL